MGVVVGVVLEEEEEVWLRCSSWKVLHISLDIICL